MLRGIGHDIAEFVASVGKALPNYFTGFDRGVPYE